MSWVLASFTLLGAALVIGFAWYERTHPSARVLALIATLAALAALGRVAFAPIPSVKPTTDIVLIAGYVLGGAPGFAVGAVAALTSNVFFGQGPWTPWQMLAWGGVGAGGALLARVAGRELGRAWLTAACAVAGLAYGAVMNFSLWVTFAGDHTLDKLTGYYVTSLPFDIAHAVGNAIFCLAFGPALVRALRRFRARFEVTWRPAPAMIGAVVLLLALPVAASADAPAQSVRWLERAQNSDGGFGGAPDQGSTQLYTGWAALGLAAAGRNPRDVERGGKSVVDYVLAHARELDDLGELNRTILLLKSSGVLPRRVGGRDLVAAVASKQRDDGSFAGPRQHHLVRDPRPRGRRPLAAGPRRCAAPRAGSPARPTTTAASTSTARARRRGSTTPAPPSRRSPRPAGATRRRCAARSRSSSASRTTTADSRSSPAAGPTRSRPRGRCRR